MTRHLAHAAVVGFVVAASALANAGSYPDGLAPIFKGIEKGKRFHAFWPPMVGQTAVGTLIQAKKPDDVQATFESIESPAFRNAQYNDAFEIGEVEYTAPEYTSARAIDVKVAFSQLDAVSERLRQAQPAPPAATAPAANAVPAQSEQEAAATPPPAKFSQATGLGVSSVADASVKVGRIVVEYYTLKTLFAIKDGRATNAIGSSLLQSDNKGWVIHRALRFDGLEYTLRSTKDIDAGFFAKVTAWLPGVSVRYYNAKTVTLKMTAPLYVGYKLWRPDIAFAGAAVDEVDVHTLGIGADEIDKNLPDAAR